MSIMEPCARVACIRKCKYTGELKYLVELEDRVDDEILMRLRLEEELAAINGDGLEGSFDFNLHHPDALDSPPEEEGPSAKKLPEFPDILDDALLMARVKKYKDAALKRKGTYKIAEEKLKDEGSKGHESLGWPLGTLQLTL